MRYILYYNIGEPVKIKTGSVAGFTLTEVIVSVALLVMVWVAAAGIIIISKMGTSVAKHKSQAVYVMEKTIETLRQTVLPSSSTTTTTVNIDTKGVPDPIANVFTGTQTVYVTTPAGMPYKQVIVLLSWKEIFFGKSKTMSEYCGTFIASNEPQLN